MIRDILEQLEKKEEVRKGLIALKAECKDVAGKHALLYALNNQLDLFYEFLGAEDPKIRKNAALILGQLGVQESLEPLYQAYCGENTLFVRSSYLTAMKELDYRVYLEELKSRLNQLRQTEPEPEAKKHVAEETALLQDMVFMMEGHKKHTFTGWQVPSRIVLLTNRNFQEITAEKLKSHRPKVFNAGVQAQTADLREVLQVRTFSELLFSLPDKSTLQIDGQNSLDEMAKSVAEQICQSSLLTFLQERHKEQDPFSFRIECKNRMDLKKKSQFTKKLGGYLEQGSQGQLINSTSHYEIELRLIENKKGDFNFLIKLYTLPDTRFSYRRESLAASIQPVHAALVMELAKDYLREGAQVLDPFCGVGTMLIERNRFLPTGDLYGIDLFGKGIEAARRNAERAKVPVNFINRDFFDFTHEYLFDEVITNMPRVMGQKNEQEIRVLYQKFWKKIQEHIGNGAILVLYCYDRDILKKTLPRSEFTIEEEFEISRVEGAYCYVLQYGV